MKNTNYYQEQFKKMLQNKATISNAKGTERIMLSNDMQWKQCFKADDSLRCHYPIFWFVSEKGDVLSLKGKPRLLEKSLKQNAGYIVYRYDIKDENGIKKQMHIKAHILVSQCFDNVHKYGKAQEVIDRQGIYAYKNGFIHTHHISNDKKDNYIDNIELLSREVHIAISKKKLNTPNAMIQLARAAANEEPQRISILQTDEPINGEKEKEHSRIIYTVDGLYMSQEEYRKLLKIKNDLSESLLIKHVTDCLNDEFFVDPKYFLNQDNFICFKVILRDNKRTINRIDINTIRGQQVIVYDNNGNCYIEENEVV